jgi:cephalosporin hydroxylase
MSAVDFQPLTVVDDATHCPVEVLAERLQKSREVNAELLQRYHDLWYESGHTWHYTHFLGVGLMKCPNDLWIYQDILSKLRPTAIVETGTYQGGSALWFAFLMDMLRIAHGRVWTVDIKDYRKTWFVEHPRITYLHGNSADPTLADAIREQLDAIEGPRLFVLDSDHSAEHVYNELTLYAPMARIGDWVVVEDTNISWRASDGSGDAGARGGLQRYADKHPAEFVQDLLSERYLLTMNPGGWLFRAKECRHAG